MYTGNMSMDVLVVLMILISGLETSPQTITETFCPQCFHMSISLYNVSRGAEREVKSLLSPVTNPSCINGSVTPSRCNTTNDVKCGTIVFQAKHVGLRNIYTGAVMMETNVIRDCVDFSLTQSDNNTEECVNLRTLPDQFLRNLTDRFAQHRTEWRTSELTYAKMCLTDGIQKDITDDVINSSEVRNDRNTTNGSYRFGHTLTFRSLEIVLFVLSIFLSLLMYP